MPEDENKLLRDAVARNCGAVLSLPSAGMLRHFKSRFLGEESGGLLIETPKDQDPLIQSLAASREEVVVAFKSGIYKIAFATTILNPLPAWKVMEEVTINALLLDQPHKVKTLQRRAFYRARVPAEYGVKARVWRITERAYLKEVPLRSVEVQCELRDISVGGIGARFIGKDGKPPVISLQDRLRVEILANDNSLVLEGRMREAPKTSSKDSIIGGICFKKLEDNLDGRKNLAQLNRIVSDLQREELRQHRMGLADVA